MYQRRVWMFVFPPTPKFMCWSSSPQSDGIWTWGLWEVIRLRWDHESGILRLGLVPSQKEEQSDLSFHEHSPGKHHVNTVSCVCKAESSPHQMLKSAVPLILDLAASRIVNTAHLLFKPPSLRYLITVTWVKTTSKSKWGKAVQWRHSEYRSRKT